MHRLGSIVLVLGVCLSLPAWAGAVVEPVKGQVYINHGKGFQAVTASTKASVGDQVMVAPDGRGKIVYSEGCVVDVHPGAVVGVAGSCKVAMAKPMLAGLEAPVAAPVTPWWVWPVAAGLIVGAACAGFCEEEHHHHPPAKPRSEE